MQQHSAASRSRILRAMVDLPFERVSTSGQIIRALKQDCPPNLGGCRDSATLVPSRLVGNVTGSGTIDAVGSWKRPAARDTFLRFRARHSALAICGKVIFGRHSRAPMTRMIDLPLPEELLRILDERALTAGLRGRHTFALSFRRTSLANLPAVRCLLRSVTKLPAAGSVPKS